MSNVKLTTFSFVSCVFAAAFPIQAAPSDAHLAGHWTFDEISQDGQSFVDSSGNGRKSIVKGTPFLVEGKVGKALHLMGPPDSVSFGYMPPAGPATVSFWVNTREMMNNRLILAPPTGTGNQAGMLRFDGGQVEVFDGSNWQLIIRHGLRYDQWLHIAVVFRANGEAIGFLNGARCQAVSAKLQFDDAGAGVGAKFIGENGNPFIGRLDDFRLYDSDLSADQIKQLFDKYGGKSESTGDNQSGCSVRESVTPR